MEWELTTWARRSLQGSTLVGGAIAVAFMAAVPAFAKQHWLTWVDAAGGPRSFTFWAPLVAHALMFWSMNLFYSMLYVGQFAWAEKYRVGRQPWAWQHPRKGERDRFASALRYSVVMVPCNQLVQLVMMYVSLNLTSRIGALSVRLEDFPSVLAIAAQVAVAMVVEDAMFYWTHRLLHDRRVYAYVHKVHHTFYHTVCWSSEMAHPLEYIVGNLLPVLAGSLLQRSHMIVLLMFILVRVFVSVEEHCGYAFPASPARVLPFGASVEGHDYHHSRNGGMFASQFALWDWLCGTDRAFQAFMDAEDAIKRRGVASVDDAGDPDAPAAAVSVARQ